MKSVPKQKKKVHILDAIEQCHESRISAMKPCTCVASVMHMFIHFITYFDLFFRCRNLCAVPPAHRSLRWHCHPHRPARLLHYCDIAYVRGHPIVHSRWVQLWPFLVGLSFCVSSYVSTCYSIHGPTIHNRCIHWCQSIDACSSCELKNNACQTVAQHLSKWEEPIQLV